MLSGNTFGPDNRGGNVAIYEGTNGGRLTSNTFVGTSILQGGVWVSLRADGYQLLGNSGDSAPVDGYQVQAKDGYGCGNVFRDNVSDVRTDGYAIHVIGARCACATTMCASNSALHAGSGLTNVAVRA